MQDQIDALNGAVAAVQSAQQAQKDRVQSQIDALNATIADLKAHPSAPDLSSQITALQSVADTLNSEFPAAAATADAPHQ